MCMICVRTINSIPVFVTTYNVTNLPVMIQVSSSRCTAHFTYALLNRRYELMFAIYMKNAS